MQYQASLMGALHLLLTQLVEAQQCMEYSTAIISTCGPVPTVKPVSPNEVLTIQMPDCVVGGGNGDARVTKTYTTVCPIPCPTGTSDQVWTVEEVYKGVTAAPVISHTGVPYGYSTFVGTCVVEGGVATKTFTVPKGAPTWTDENGSHGGGNSNNNNNDNSNSSSGSNNGGDMNGSGSNGGNGNGNGNGNGGTIVVPTGETASITRKSIVLLAALGLLVGF